MQVLVGTSGYSYKEWKGSFYPEDLKNADMLHYYAERFSSVEIRIPVAIAPTAPVGEQAVEATAVFFYCSIREAWCRRGTSTVDFSVRVP